MQGTQRDDVIKPVAEEELDAVLEVRKEIAIGADGPRSWPMWRDPQ